MTTVLFVDDEPAIVKMVGKRLEVEGFHVVTALDGEEALKAVQAQPPDVMVLDIMLPKLDGYHVCRVLKSEQAFRSIPIIMLTAKVQEQDERLGMEAGADAYIRKPFKAQELIETIRTLAHRAKPAE